MDPFPDYEFHRADREQMPASRPAHSPGLWVAVALFLAAAGGAAYVALGTGRPFAPRAVAAPPAALAREALPPSLGGQPEPITVPPLDDTDPLVRKLGLALSESPAVVAWLATTGLIRNAAEVVAHIANGATPARLLGLLRPKAGFRVIERDGNTYVDPRSYERYADITNAVASVDPAGAARLYATLKSRLEEAYQDLGESPQSFDRPLEEAIVMLLNTPVVEGSVRLKPQGIGYAYVDERLEGLTDAQKQLLRMGPRTVQIVETKLRAIGLALGMSSASLSANRPITTR